MFRLKSIRPLLSYVLLLLAAGMTLILLAIGSGQFAATPLTPFLPYKDIMPGQPVSHVEERNFDCESEPSTHDRRCTIQPQQGIFSRISLVSRDNTIQTVRFSIRENSLKAGSLMVVWEQPDMYRQSLTILSWKRDYLRLNTWHRPVTPFTPVEEMIFSNRNDDPRILMSVRVDTNVLFVLHLPPPTQMQLAALWPIHAASVAMNG
jgi:hypothetical protein